MRYRRFLIFIISFFTLRVIGFTPDARTGQASILLDTRIYYGGGEGKILLQGLNDFFYLDLSNSFQTDSPPWVTEVNIPISVFLPTTVIIDNSTFYLVGGYLQNSNTHVADFSTTVFMFNSTNKEWSKPKLGGNDTLSQRLEMSAVVESGFAYIFGGAMVTNATSFTGIMFNDMVILDIKKGVWTTITPTSSFPKKRIDYTATLLSNGNIVYIGGREDSENIFTTANLIQIWLFDTRLLTWSSMNTTGIVPGPRAFHSAVLTNNGQIVVFGGEYYNNSATPNLVVLDTTTSPFNWYIPTASTGPYDPPPLSYHSANLYGDQMIVTFGYVPNPQGNINDTTLNTKMYILNTTSYSWINSFTAPSNSTSAPESGLTQRQKLIIAISVPLALLILMAVIFAYAYVLRSRRERESELLRIAGGTKEPERS